jgi:hypothetical protein
MQLIEGAMSSSLSRRSFILKWMSIFAREFGCLHHVEAAVLSYYKRRETCSLITEVQEEAENI